MIIILFRRQRKIKKKSTINDQKVIKYLNSGHYFLFGHNIFMDNIYILKKNRIYKTVVYIQQSFEQFGKVHSTICNIYSFCFVLVTFCFVLNPILLGIVNFEKY